MRRYDLLDTMLNRSPLRNRPCGVTAVSLAFVFVMIGCGLFLTACSPPVRAPVVSREKTTVKPPSKPTYYRVVKGDTLYSISWRFRFAHHSLARWNGIPSPYTIYPGQKLRLLPLKNAPSKRAAEKSKAKDRSISQGKTTTATKKRQSYSPPNRSKNPTKITQKQPNRKKPQESLKFSWGWPTRGTLVQRFVKGDSLRKGVKLRGSVGQPVKAAEAGKVVYAGSGLVGYGRLIIIKHNKSYLSAYGLNRRILVKEGDQVSKGTSIAEMGEDGSGNAQLHFEIRRNGAPVNPLALLPRHN